MAALPPVRQSLAGQLIEAVWTSLPELDGGYGPKGAAILAEPLAKADALGIGPGWGLHASNSNFLVELLAQINKTHPDLPIVVDADGLKLLAEIPEWWKKLPSETILTPHPGEMAILTGKPIAEIQADRWETAHHYAKDWGVTLVLKGALTVIGTPDGKLFVNPISDSALGTAGSGDVLTGVLCGLLAQCVSAQNAAVMGVWLHGRAGHLAHEQLGGPESVTALDILEALPQALGETKKAGH
jgi:NAD(P)H-hydrate epimerase